MKNAAFFIILSLAAMLCSCGNNGNNPESEVTDVELGSNWLFMTDSESIAISASAFNGEVAVSADFDWSSSDASVAIVSDGIITGIGAGTALITADAEGVSSEPCTIHVADEWILYSGSDSLRIITPDNTRDMAIPGTYSAIGAILRFDDGIIYVAEAQYTFNYLYFRPFNSNNTQFVFSNFIEPIYDLRLSSAGNILMSRYLSYSIFSFPSASGLVNDLNSYIDFTLGNVDIREFDVSPSGGFIIDATTSAGPRMLFVSSDGEPGDTLLTTNGKSPRFSPDGTKIAYGNTGRIWLADVETMTRTELLSEGSSIDGISWSPDGTHIAMCVRNALGQYELWVGNASTGEKVKLTEAEPSNEHFSPQWIE
ncbi:PD40 domain-containing protein [bacterium]|nr:PD40 domain-containing protein [bacterium]